MNDVFIVNSTVLPTIFKKDTAIVLCEKYCFTGVTFFKTPFVSAVSIHNLAKTRVSTNPVTTFNVDSGKAILLNPHKLRLS